MDSLTIPNSIGWSHDHKIMFYVNTTEGKIIAHDYDAQTGTISNERVFYKHLGPGSPDGFRLDENGCIWQAIYGGGCVLQINLEGKVVGKVSYPTRNITCPIFVGKELWVTTADEEDETESESVRYGGGIFRVDVGVKGAQEFEFKLEEGVSIP